MIFSCDTGGVAGDYVIVFAHGLIANDPIEFVPYRAGLPAPLAERTTYYVKTVLNADSFTVSLTPGGTGINLTSQSSGFVRPLGAQVDHPPGSICVSDDVGTLSIDGISLNTPAWGIPDLRPLFVKLPALRGDNIKLPGISGQRPYPRRIDQDVILLSIDVSGACDQNGSPYANEEIGIELNAAYLLANVLYPPEPPTATRPAELVTPSGATYTADVQITAFHEREADEPGLLRYVIELTIPDGRFS